jgi:hypothetical protein
LIPASTIVESTPFPDHLFGITNVFNNLAIQHFPASAIPQEETDPFWSSVSLKEKGDSNSEDEDEDAKSRK